MDDAGGVVNAKLDPGETADLHIVLRNAGASVGPVAGRLESSSQFLNVLGPDGSFPAVAEGETTVSGGSGFRVCAAADAPVELPACCYLILDGSGYHDTVLIPVLVGDSTNLPAGPDPGAYRIYDYTDSCYARMPAYDWFELRGVGTRLALGPDETRQIPLPVAFGRWRYYGVDYDTISVCANGWVAAGWTDRCDFVNVQLPCPNAPPNIVALQWDDLDPTAFGSVWLYHDTLNHRLIVEYDSVPYFGHLRDWEKVQLQLFDQTVATPTGDNSMLLHFRTANNFSQATVGFQNQDGSAGLTHTCNNWYPRVSAPLIPHRALRFETVELTGSEESRSRVPDSVGPAPLVAPNPCRARSRLSLTRAAPGTRLGVYSADGRLLAVHLVRASPLDFWFPNLPPGLYFLRSLPAQSSPARKLVVLP